MDATTYLKFLIALIFVLALIGVLAAVARKLGFGPRTGMIGRDKRLALIEVMSLDAKHRVCLIQRDDVQHLIVIGPEADTVIETGIPAPPLPEPRDGETVVSFGQALKQTFQQTTGRSKEEHTGS